MGGYGWHSSHHIRGENNLYFHEKCDQYLDADGHVVLRGL